jgi:2-C-methyl-D-erythritol 4-phosphate cytidylyltransferase
MIIVAAGRSVRFGGDKLMTAVGGLPLVAHTVSAVASQVDRCILVCREDQVSALKRLDLGAAIVPGGPTRTASEMAGLAAIGEAASLIGVHDGARPLVTPALIEILFQTAERVGGAVPVVHPAQPLVQKPDLSLVQGAMVAQTPQVFRGEELLAAYVSAAKMEYAAQDTAEIAQRFGRLAIQAVPGDPDNAKVTEPGDIEQIREALETSRNEPR